MRHSGPYCSIKSVDLCQLIKRNVFYVTVLLNLFFFQKDGRKNKPAHCYCPTSNGFSHGQDIIDPSSKTLYLVRIAIAQFLEKEIEMVKLAIHQGETGF